MYKNNQRRRCQIDDAAVHAKSLIRDDALKQAWRQLKKKKKKAAIASHNWKYKCYFEFISCKWINTVFYYLSSRAGRRDILSCYFIVFN